MHSQLRPWSELLVFAYIYHLAEENFNKSFFRIIDTSDNGVISKKEMNAFNPCAEYKPRKLNNIF